MNDRYRDSVGMRVFENFLQLLAQFIGGLGGLRRLVFSAAGQIGVSKKMRTARIIHFTVFILRRQLGQSQPFIIRRGGEIW